MLAFISNTFHISLTMIVILGFMYFIPLFVMMMIRLLSVTFERLLFESQWYQWADMLLNDAQNHWNEPNYKMAIYSGVLWNDVVINNTRDDVNLLLLIVINCLIYFDTFVFFVFRPRLNLKWWWLVIMMKWPLATLSVAVQRDKLLFCFFVSCVALNWVQLFDRLFLHLKMVKKRKK